MTVQDDPRLVDAKSKSVEHVLGLLKITGLRRTPNKRELCGPCPKCGVAGHNPKSGPSDRFNINLATGAFFCRQCDIRGGDVIALVRAVEDCTFPDALTLLCGEKPKEETEEQRRDREKRQRDLKKELKRQADERERAAERYRRKAVADASAIWRRARPNHPGVVHAYLRARGLDPDLLPEMPALRFLVDHPYVKKQGRDYVTMHRGPCMIAGILNADGHLTAVHQTWLDQTPPHGKAQIVYEGQSQTAKLVRGSKKGGAIRLHTPPGPDTLVMGEGIETTLTALIARPFENAAYWAGIDLGNMGGIMQKIPGTRYSGLPDMTDTEAFVPPTWVKRFVYIMDGDSNPKMTRAKLESGIKRAMALRPGLRGQIVHAGVGVDLNDLINPDDDGGADA